MNIEDFKLYADIIGYSGVFFTIFAFLSHNRKTMLIYNILGTCAFGLNVLAYNGTTGAIISFTSVLIMLISILEKDELNKALIYMSPILGIITFFILDEGLIGLFPAVGTVFATIGNLNKEILNMKIIFIGSATSWLVFGILIGSIPAIIQDIVGLICLFYAIYKIKQNQSKEINSPSNI